METQEDRIKKEFFDHMGFNGNREEKEYLLRCCDWSEDGQVEDFVAFGGETPDRGWCDRARELYSKIK